MTIKSLPVLAVVVPCFNESESIDYAVSQLTSVLNCLAKANLIAKNSFLFFVDDGSVDDTWKKLVNWNLDNEKVKGLRLSRNFGHQAALMAGLTEVAHCCDAAISIDADLQQDPEAINDFIIKFLEGADVVLGVRSDRKADGLFKRKTAKAFYTFMQAMGVKLLPNHADYRLLSKRALEALMRFPESNLFLRGICMLLGFKVETVEFEVKARQFGASSYSLKKMLQLAIHGITSFSIVPLRMVAAIGFLFWGFSLIMGGYVLWHTLIIGDTLPGWASTTLPIYFFGGLQLFCMGVVGEYIGQIYITVKNRPRWIGESRLD